ncbi:hypothetical protein D3C78_1317550 [compost metagenome]
MQVIAVVEDRLFHGLLRVGLIIHTEPVGFVVRHVITAIVFKGQVDEAFEHAIELHRFGCHAGHAPMRMLTHQFVEFEYIDFMAGEPEFHFDPILLQLFEYNRWLPAGNR